MLAIGDPRIERELTMLPGDGTLVSASATPRSIGLIRTVAGAFGAVADLTVDQLEDLRLLVDAVCELLLERFAGLGDDPGRLSVRFRRDVDTVVIDARRVGVREVGGNASVSVMVLDALTTRWSVVIDGSDAIAAAAVDVRR